MKPLQLLKSAALTMAGLGLAVPPGNLLAASPAAPAARPAAAQVADVKLTADGVLRGQIVDPQGRALAGTTIKAYQQGREVAQGTCDEDGSFALAGLRGGAYVLVAGQTSTACRVWTARTAPPSAQAALLIVDNQPLARGAGERLGGMNGGLLMLGAMGGIVAAGVTSQDDESGS
jgi:hypothetical protein